MSPYFGWLDTCEEDRRRALDVIDLFSLRETRDELGLGTVRDALADRYFPATSTIQTRARYFLFIPWIYQDLEHRTLEPAEVARRLRTEELRLRDQLVGSSDATGTVGGRAGKAVKRLPSSIYWYGLGALGIRIAPGTMESYHRSWRTREVSAWHPHIPKAPRDFPEGVSLAMRPEEADYLRDRFRARGPESFITLLLDEAELYERTSFIWEHPAASDAPRPLKSAIEHGRHFSELMYGASLLYNLMLAQLAKHDEWVADYESGFAAWAAEGRTGHEQWNRADFWTLVGSARVPVPTHSFCEQWITHALTGEHGTPRARELITRRERQLKGPRSRIDNRQYLDTWSVSAGAYQITYRWGIAQTLVHDILTALTEQAHAQSA